MVITITLSAKTLKAVRLVLIALHLTWLLVKWRALEKRHWSSRRLIHGKSTYEGYPDFTINTAKCRQHIINTVYSVRLAVHMWWARLLYCLLYMPVVTLASYMHGHAYIWLVRVGAWLRGDTWDYMIGRVVNHIDQIESKRKEDKSMKPTNAAVKVGEIKFSPITQYMLSHACTEEQRAACIDTITTGDFGPVNNAGLSAAYKDGNICVRPMAEVPAVLHGSIVSA